MSYFSASLLTVTGCQVTCGSLGLQLFVKGLHMLLNAPLLVPAAMQQFSSLVHSLVNDVDISTQGGIHKVTVPKVFNPRRQKYTHSLLE